MMQLTRPAGSVAENPCSAGFPSKALHRERMTMSSMAHILSSARAPRSSSQRKTR